LVITYWPRFVWMAAVDQSKPDSSMLLMPAILTVLRSNPTAGGLLPCDLDSTLSFGPANAQVTDGGVDAALLVLGPALRPSGRLSAQVAPAVFSSVSRTHSAIMLSAPNGKCYPSASDATGWNRVESFSLVVG
jgi:hypothetical protein